MKKSIVYLGIAIAAVLAFSCKKDDSTTSLPSLMGLYLENDPLPYVAPGTTITLKADVSAMYTSDLSTPEKPIGLYWTVNGSTTQRDTLTRDVSISNPAFSYTPTEVGYVTISCVAFSEGYYAASTSTNFSAIDPETSITGLEGKTATIGNNKFYVTDINGVSWMGNNLYGTQSGVSFFLSDVTDTFMGKFYTWEEALTACPEGWKLPTAQEWDALGDDACALMTDAYMLESKLWPYWPGITITNAKQFNAIPAGYVDRNGGDSNVQGFMGYAIFWTASESEEDPMLAQYRYIYADKSKVQQGEGSKTSLALSVRCIKK